MPLKEEGECERNRIKYKRKKLKQMQQTMGKKRVI